MKRLALASVLFSVGAFGACAVEEPPVVTDPGAGTGPVAGSPAMGGTAGVGAQGGAAGSVTGGTAGTTGGTITGGSAGALTGGTAGIGGNAMGGNAMGGNAMGGNAMGGEAMGGNAMGGNAMGGNAMGGNAMGGAGTGGTGGSPCPSVAELFPVGPVGQPANVMGSLDGRLIQTPCQDTPTTDDCNSDGWFYGGVRTACSGSRLEIRQEFMVGGTPGRMYNVTMHFYGVMEPKPYNNVTRDAGTGRPGNQNTGAMPTPWASCNTPGCTVPGGTYNSYEIHVMSNTGTEVGTYFLNADTQEGHYTYVINFEKTIPIVGGGRVRMYTTDGNCRQIKNCGSSAGYPCAAKARTVTITAAMPQPMTGALPAGFTQPGLGKTNDHAGQWFLTDVTAVACP